MNKNKKIFSALLLLFLAASAWGRGSDEAGVKAWRIAGLHAPGSLETRSTQMFTDLANEKTKGTLSLTFYPAGQLGESNAILELLQSGTVEVHANTSTWHTKFITEWEVLSFPYSVKDRAHLERIKQSSWFKAGEQRYLDEFKVKILASNGYRLPRHILHTSKGIISPNDIKGVKFRAADLKINLKPWIDFGADVTIIPFSETAMALQTGLVNAMECPATTLYPQKFYVGAKHITLTGHVMDTFDLLIGKAAWEGISEATQKALTESAEKALDFYAAENDAVWADHMNKMKAEGVTFYDPNMDTWRKEASEIAKKWEAEGEWEKGLFERILNM